MQYVLAVYCREYGGVGFIGSRNKNMSPPPSQQAKDQVLLQFNGVAAKEVGARLYKVSLYEGSQALGTSRMGIVCRGMTSCYS